MNTRNCTGKPNDVVSWMTVMVTLLVVTVGYAFVYCVFPGFSDELWYTLPFRRWQEGMASYPLCGIVDEIAALNNEENIRGAIVFHILTAWIPSPVMGIMMGIVIFLTFYIGSRMCGIGGYTPLLSVLGMAAYIVCFPWHEVMFTRVFAYNYVWSSMLSLLAALLFLGKREKYGPVGMALLSIFALILGIWHEGFSVPVLVGFGMYALLNFRSMDLRRWILTVGLVPGIVLQFMSPGTQSRLAHQIGWAFASVGDTVMLMMSHPLSLLYLAVFIVVLCVPSLREKSQVGRGSFLVFIAIVALTVLVIHARAVRQLRVAWPGELFSLAGLLILSDRLLGRRFTEPSRWTVGVSVVIGLVLCLHVAYVDVYAWEINRQDKSISAEFASSSDGVVFADFLTEYDAPFMTLKRPWFEMYTSTWYRDFASAYYDDDKYPNIIPSVLENVPDADFVKVPGCNPFYRIGKTIFAKAPYSGNELPSDFESKGFWTLSFGSYQKTVKVRYSYFRGRDEEWYVFLYPERIYRDLKSADITGIDEWSGAESRYQDNPSYKFKLK